MNLIKGRGNAALSVSRVGAQGDFELCRYSLSE